MGLTGEARGKGAWIGAIAGHCTEKEIGPIESAQHIQEEEKRKDKDFEANIDEISQIVMTKPGFAKAGHLRIILKSEPEIDIQLGDKGFRATQRPN